MFRQYSATELEPMETLACAQADDLKVREAGFSVWLSRVDNTVSYEVLEDGKWIDFEFA